MKSKNIIWLSAIVATMSLTSCDSLLALNGGSSGVVYTSGGDVYNAGYGSDYGGRYAYSGIRYEDARRQALFLSDKMAYELGLNDAQYEAIYEINLDYLLNMRGENSIYGDYWARRNSDIFYVLNASQYNYFVNMDYFYRPVYWYDNTYASAFTAVTTIHATSIAHILYTTILIEVVEILENKVITPGDLVDEQGSLL